MLCLVKQTKERRKGKLLKRIWGFMKVFFCRHLDTETKLFYEKECEMLPVVKIYAERTCRSCGMKTVIPLSEIATCYYKLPAIEEDLRNKGMEYRERATLAQVCSC
jgi:hypothetical protein